MLHIALFQPEIPQNTGNIIRLSANCGAQLHLIYPMGFAIDDKRAKRAGLDYHELARVQHHQDYAAFQQAVTGQRIIACSTKGKTTHSDFSYQDGDVLLFGPETRGLPADVLAELGDCIVRIPMLPQSRSLNLSNAVAIITYEAWRQLEYSI